MTYAEKLQDRRWQKKRLEVMQAAGWRCLLCCKHNDNSPLHIHHLLYRKEADPWDYPNELLLCLCEGCHEQMENVRSDVLEFMGKEILEYDMYFERLAKAGLSKAQVINRLKTWCENYEVFAFGDSPRGTF